jgi:hypothetical protein
MADAPQSPTGEWLVLIHQLPPGGSNPRVRIWRRLQDLGAVSLRNAVYLLPNSAQAREDFAWVKDEIASLRGQATVLAANVTDPADRQALVEAFREARAADYAAVQGDLARVAKRASHARHRDPVGALRTLRALRERVRTVQAIDFFAAPGGAEASQALAALEAQMGTTGSTVTSRKAAAAADTAKYRGRTWVTRRRPGVDRMACAWLIRRFIDPKASFAFSAADTVLSTDQVPFDMFGGEFSHHDGRCTFEVLLDRFHLETPPLRRVAQIVHDVDLKDHRFDPPEAMTIGMLVEGVRQAHSDDADALARGMEIFEALHRSFETSGPSTTPGAGPRRVKRPRITRARRRTK